MKSYARLSFAYAHPDHRQHVIDGHRVTVLAQADDHTSELVEMGCRFVPLAMDVKGHFPSKDSVLVASCVQHFRQECPDVVLGYTIKNNILGALAARLTGIPFVPNVTGLGTAFLSGKVLQTLSGRRVSASAATFT